MNYNLAELFESVVDAVPDWEALVCGDRRLTYAQLDERANRLAHYLASQGVGSGDHIALYTYNCTEYLEGMLAAYKVRAVPINVNYRYVEEELKYLFDDADIVAVIHHREFGPRLAAAGLADLKCALYVEDGSGAETTAPEYESTIAASDPTRDFTDRSPDDIYIVYTGGTTGMPKGVMWRQEDIFFGALGGGNIMGDPIERPEELAEKAGEKGGQMVMMAIAPLMHAAAHWSSFIGFFAADKIVLYDGKSFDADRIIQTIDRESVNSIGIVGDAMARPLADAMARPDTSYDGSSLVVIGSGAAVLSPSVKEHLQEQFPNSMILDNFGVSETGYQGRGMSSASDGRGPSFICDDTTNVLGEDMKPVKPGSGEVGHLAKRGHLPLGYYKDETKTAKTFVTVDGVRWALPGDMATVEEDGAITLLGRGSQCINTGGEKVYPEEVETALKSCPGVFDVLVVGIPDDRFGSKVAAVVQTRDGASLTLEDVQSHCRSHVAGYKVPRALCIVDKVQRQPSGKPDYRWAKDIAAASAVAS